ncbi:MAG: RNA methyltransferase [Actinomycetota bacterium]|nr:RNA methyltransferase [Actinomycetota bacterium]
MRIESTTNQRIKAVRRLHRGRERRQMGRTLLEGPKIIGAALDVGVVPLEVYTVDGGPIVDRCDAAGSEVIEVSRIVLETVATTVEPQDPVAVIEVPAGTSLGPERVVVLVDIADPGNLGTLIRSAAALGWQVALLGGADPWNPKVLRSAAGSHFTRVPVRIADLSELAALGHATVATVVEGGQEPSAVEIDAPIALLVGSESHGLPSEMVNQCDVTMTIPMSADSESLNAAVAGSIAMYALSGPN